MGLKTFDLVCWGFFSVDVAMVNKFLLPLRRKLFNVMLWD